MDEDWSHMTEKILDLTLEIIYLLTGEDYEVVKKTMQKQATCKDGLRLSNKIYRSSTGTMSLPESGMPGRNNKKILEVTQNIIELLTGEVPIRCQDVSVYFSMEEWEYLEGHKDLYKDVMMENQPPLTSLDGSSNRNPPERGSRPRKSQDSTKKIHKKKVKSPLHFRNVNHSPSPPYSQESMLEDDSISDHFQLENLSNIKVEEIDEEEETLIRSYLQRKEAEGPIEIGVDGHMRKISEEHLLLSTDCHVKDEELSQDSFEELPGSPNTYGELQSRSPDPSHPGEDSPDNLDNIVSMAQRGSKMFPCSVCGKWFTTYGGLLMHQRLHTGVKPFSCSFCGKSFTQKGILVNHEKIHRGIKPFPCSVCGKCFAKKSDVVRHLRVHTGEKPFPCARCGRCFSQKSSLLNHLRLYICEKPYPCFICGKRFSQRSELGRHQEMHRRKKTSPWSG